MEKILEKKIIPTEEMIKQSELWETESEDLEKVKILFEEIMNIAKLKGFAGIYDIDETSDETLCYIYDDEKAKELCLLGKSDNWECVGHPLALIRVLEQKFLK